MLNALAMLVIYRQVTVFLSMEADRLERKCSWSKHLAPVLAFLIVSRLELIQESGSYMVELLALPFLLEMVFLLLRGLDEAKREHEAVLLDVYKRQDYMNEVLERDGAHVDAFYYCPHHPEHGIGLYKKKCHCRKPETGMFEMAERDLPEGIDRCV